MKLKQKTNSLTILLSISIVVGFITCTSRDKQTSALQDRNHVDSVVVAYYNSDGLAFADTTAEEITEDFQQGRLSSFCLRNQDTIRLLTERVACLTSLRDSLTPDIDAHVMLILYKMESENDSLFISKMPLHRLQLNNITKEPDSLLWVHIRDIICCRDSIFYERFNNARSYYIENSVLSRFGIRID